MSCPSPKMARRNAFADLKPQTQRRESAGLTHDDFDEHDARAMIVSSSAYLLIAAPNAGHG